LAVAVLKALLWTLKLASWSPTGYRLLTPEGAKPADVAKVVKELIVHFEYKGVVGCGFPAVIRQGIAYSAANVHQSWIGTDVNQLLSEATGCQVFTLNDADAAGIAEMKFGVGRKLEKGVAMILTLGTGIGTAMFSDGHLLPNTEFGHLKIRGKDAEFRASDAVRQKKRLSWKKYSTRLQEYLDEMEALFSPDLIIIGGGLSKSHDKFFPHLKVKAKIVPAELLNQAGIVGAAIFASQQG
jgi:polyphosphate glucokinase